MRKPRRYSPAASSVRCACLIAASLPVSVAWADWEIDSDVEMGVEANDNPRLGQRGTFGVPSPEDDHTAVRMFTDALIQLANVGPRGQIYLRPRVRLDTYADDLDDDLQRDDLYLNGRAEYQWTRSSVGLRGNAQRESILSAETLEADVIDPDETIPDPVDTESGQLLLLNEHRTRTLFAPYASFSISERSDISVEATLLDVWYTGPQLPGRADFTNSRFAVGVGRTIDDRSRAEARLVTSTFEADFTGNQTDTVGVEGTFRRTLSELWSFALTTGLQRNEFTYVDPQDPTGAVVDNASSDFTMTVGLRKRTEQSRLNLDVQRLLNPNAVGFLVKQDQFRMVYERQMSERLTGAVAARYTQYRTLETPGESFGRDYMRVDLDVEWAFTPTWSLNVGYSVIDQEFTGTQQAGGTANVFTVGAVYRSLSRNAN